MSNKNYIAKFETKNFGGLENNLIWNLLKEQFVCAYNEYCEKANGGITEMLNEMFKKENPIGKDHFDGGHSGRYPWGSGEEQFKTARDFYDRVNVFYKEGYSKADPERRAF